MSHTPGPWMSTPWRHGKDSVVNEVAIHSEFGQWIGDTVVDQDCDTADVDNMIANAKLIAAAPELLEACIEANRLYSSYGMTAQHSDCGKWINQLRDAIAKATE